MAIDIMVEGFRAFVAQGSWSETCGPSGHRVSSIKLFPCTRFLTVIGVAIALFGVSANVSAQARERETELANIYESKIVEFWNKHGQRRDFAGIHGVRVAAMAFPRPGGERRDCDFQRLR